MANFVFPRRTLQEAINRLSNTLTTEQLAPIVRRMNLKHTDRIPAMWELVLLDGLSKCGGLRNEPTLAGGKRPDFELTAHPVSGDGLTIVGDITCVSDKGLDENNPVDALSKAVHRIATEAGLESRRFGVDIAGFRDGPVGNSRMRLRLPPGQELERLLSKQLGPWLESAKAAPHKRSQYSWQDEQTEVTLTYDPTQPYFTVGYPSYTGATSRSKHPLFASLRSKAKQLRNASSEALTIIVACDGGCDLLAVPSQTVYGTYSATEVTEDFLRQNSGVCAVLLLAVEEGHAPVSRERSYSLVHQLFLSKSPRNQERMSPESVTALEALLQEVVSTLPPPMQTAVNAVIRSKASKIGPDRIGGYTMTENSVTLSSRALQRLLAGEIAVEKFIELHGWDQPSTRNPFALMKKRGRMIGRIDVAPAAGKDDDGLIFHFGDPDPAAAPFKIPNKQ